MSQHFLQPYEPEKFEVVVGYDRPLDYYFAEVRNLIEPDTESVYIEGTLQIDRLRADIAPFANLTVTVAQELIAERADRDNHPAHLVRDHRVPTSAQRAATEGKPIDEGSALASADPQTDRNDARIGTVLAALRYLQCALDSDALPEGLRDAAVDVDVDDLCEAINFQKYFRVNRDALGDSQDLLVDENEGGGRSKAIILAALRYYRDSPDIGTEILEIASNGHTLEPLSDNETVELISAIEKNDYVARPKLFDLPVFTVRPSDVLLDRDSMKSDAALTASLVGRSELGDRVFAKLQAGSFVSVDPAVFGHLMPRLNQAFTLRRTAGNDVVETPAFDIAHER